MNKDISKNLEVFLVERNNLDTKKHKIIHKFDGRIIPLEPRVLRETAQELANMLNLEKVDYIVGFAEGGLLAAYGVSMVTDIPMIGSYRVRLKSSPEIIFTEPHSERSTHYIYGLKPGDRIVIVEDEITTGSTLVSAVSELTKKNIDVVDIGSYIICKNFMDKKHPELEKYNIKHLLAYGNHIY
ncbi:MAG: phosphoribosyltransferase domain-containing protein [Candidatus Woesearchaeota archaeon]